MVNIHYVYFYHIDNQWSVWPFSAMLFMSSFKLIQAKYNRNFLRVPDVFSLYLQNKCYVYGI